LKKKAQENLERPTKLFCQELLVNGDIEHLLAEYILVMGIIEWNNRIIRLS
jgi:hypothetical protein